MTGTEMLRTPAVVSRVPPGPQIARNLGVTRKGLENRYSLVLHTPPEPECRELLWELANPNQAVMFAADGDLI